MIKTGRYIAAIMKHKIPIPMQPINPKILCFFDNLGQNGSDSASESHEDPPSLLYKISLKTTRRGKIYLLRGLGSGMFSWIFDALLTKLPKPVFAQPSRLAVSDSSSPASPMFT